MRAPKQKARSRSGLRSGWLGDPSRRWRYILEPTGEYRAPERGEWYVARNGEGITRCSWRQRLRPVWILRLTMVDLGPSPSPPPPPTAPPRARWHLMRSQYRWVKHFAQRGEIEKMERCYARLVHIGQMPIEVPGWWAEQYERRRPWRDLLREASDLVLEARRRAQESPQPGAEAGGMAQRAKDVSTASASSSCPSSSSSGSHPPPE